MNKKSLQHGVCGWLARFGWQDKNFTPRCFSPLLSFQIALLKRFSRKLLVSQRQILRQMEVIQSECTKPRISMCSGGDLLINLTDPTPCGDGELQLAGNSINWIQLRLGPRTNWICPSVRRLQSSERLEDPGCDDKMTG